MTSSVVSHGRPLTGSSRIADHFTVHEKRPLRRQPDGFDYAVLHYGVGNGGKPGSGGGVELFYLNGESEFTFPFIGTGPNGFGEFSSLTLFKGDNRNGSVPDGGSTLMLLGTALGLIAAARRRFRV